MEQGYSQTVIQMLLMDHGEIIITELEDKGDTASFNFITPAVVEVERTAHAHGPIGLMLHPWVPIELLSGSGVSVMAAKVVAVMDASPEMASLYISWATIERDKKQTFEEHFKLQVASIEKFQLDKYASSKMHTLQHIKNHRKKELFVQGTPIPDSIIAMFEEDNQWGNSSVTQ